MDRDWQEGRLEEARRNGNRLEEARALLALGNIFARSGDIPESIRFIQEATLLSELADDNEGAATSSHILAATYRYGLSDPNTALKWMERAISFARLSPSHIGTIPPHPVHSLENYLWVRDRIRSEIM